MNIAFTFSEAIHEFRLPPMRGVRDEAAVYHRESVTTPSHPPSYFGGNFGNFKNGPLRVTNVD
jgi:hypothetical protein